MKDKERPSWNSFNGFQGFLLSSGLTGGFLVFFYLFAKRGDVSLKGSVHPVEGLGLAEVVSHILRQLFLLVLDLHHELFPVIKEPFFRRKKQRRYRSLSLFVSIFVHHRHIHHPPAYNQCEAASFRLNNV